MTPVRRAFFTLAAFSAIIGTAHAANPVMFRDAGCGCCLKWLEQVKSSFGAKAVIVNSPDMAAVKDKQGVPTALRSCHTVRSEEHTSELQSLMRISYAVFCLTKKNI